jgi:hypothetical protein
VFNARGVVCGCVNIAPKFTPQARMMFLESKRAKTAHDAGLDKHCTM